MRKGKIFTYSVVNSASEKFADKIPYALAIIEEGDKKFLTRLNNYKAETPLEIGMEVEILPTENEKDIPLCNLL
jgi:uncharacterized OB-fold protein